MLAHGLRNVKRKRPIKVGYFANNGIIWLKNLPKFLLVPAQIFGF
jgi:hypothetical protein